VCGKKKKFKLGQQCVFRKILQFWFFYECVKILRASFLPHTQ
jgi:hypothetical protein